MSNKANSPQKPPSENGHRLLEEQIKLLYSQASVGMIATLVNSIILNVVLWNVVSHSILIIWLAGILSITLFRYILVLMYRRALKGQRDGRPWDSWFIAGIALSGTAWGASAVFLFPPESIAHQVFIAFVLGGMVAGSVAALTTIMGAFLAFCIPTLLPVTVRFFAQGGDIGIAMGVMTTLFGVLMITNAVRLHKDIKASLKLRFKNADLLSDLKTSKENLEKLNKELNLDITEHIRALETLRKSDESLTMAQQIAHIGNWDIDLATNEIHWSEEIYRIFGMDTKDFGITYEAFFNFIHPDDRDLAKKNIARALFDYRSFNIEYRIIRPDGNERVVQAQAEVVRNENNEPKSIVGTIHDITERHTSEAALEKLDNAVSQATDAVVITDTQGAIEYVNPAFERITGYSREEVIGQHTRTLKSGEHDEKFYKDLWETIKSGNIWNGEITNRRKSGELYTEGMTISPVMNEQGNITNFIAIKNDITERKKMEKVIRRLADLPRDNPDPIVEINMETGTVQYCNPAGINEFPELDPGTPEKRTEQIFIDWNHPLLRGLKSVTDYLMRDGTGKLLRAMKAVIGKQGSENYKVYGRQLRYIPEENLIRLYTVDLTKEEELLVETRGLLSEVEQIRKELEDEQKEAEKVGKSLLMKKPHDPRLKTCVEVESCSKAGGDRAGFLVEKTAKGRRENNWLAVFDASGHGKGAAKFQEVALGGLLTLLAMGHPMVNVLVIINITLEKLNTGRFLVGNVWRVMHAKERKVEKGWALIEEFNIGQHSVLVLGPEERKVKEWEWPQGETSGRTLPMALFEDGFDELQVRYRKVRNGSRTVTYTDGITEAQNIKGEQFGNNRLKELILKTRNLSPCIAHQTIVKTIKCWVGELPLDTRMEELDKVPMQDDITVAVVDIDANQAPKNN